jgi:Spy/CpxP family protein refolding chaperone
MLLHRRYAWVLTLFLAVPLLATGARAAQQQGSGEDEPKAEEERRGPMSPEDRLAKMTKDFKLTDAQQSKIKPILVDTEAKMNELRNDPNNNRQIMRTKVMNIMQGANKQIRAQLDDKQKEKFDRQEEERMARMQNRRRGGPVVPSGDNSGPPAAPQK